MMKKLKSLLYLALAGLQMLAFAACGPRENENDANKTKLKVSYFKAGYGEEWILTVKTRLYNIFHIEVAF